MHENECARNFAWLSAGDDDDDDDVECVLLALWIDDALLTQSNNVPHELDVERIDGCFLLHHVGRLDCGEAHRCKGTGVLVKMRKMRSCAEDFKGGCTLSECVGQAFGRWG